MKGFVATPPDIARQMTALLFDGQAPTGDDRVLYPGVGEGPFIDAVQNYCEANSYPIPSGYACDTHDGRLSVAQEQFSNLPIKFEIADFLDTSRDIGDFDYIIGNPPYVPITEIDNQRKVRYRKSYETASGRFDLYLLFFERALELLAEEGQLVFITPEKFEYTKTAAPLRRILSGYHVMELRHLEESTFEEHIAYPTISVVRSGEGSKTTVVSRDGSSHETELPTDGSRWTENVRDTKSTLDTTGITLGDIAKRISPGVATGADSVFTFAEANLPPQLEPWTVPTVSGKELEQSPLEGPINTKSVLVCPYDKQGNLVPESELGQFGNWLNSLHRSRLEDRSCYQNSDRCWYAWHENPPMIDICQEKILFRDLTDTPRFWRDSSCSIIPRHSVYYLVPEEGANTEKLQSYLNSPGVTQWLQSNCQRAHNNYLRLQSHVLEDLPIPERLSPESTAKP